MGNSQSTYDSTSRGTAGAVGGTLNAWVYEAAGQRLVLSDSTRWAHMLPGTHIAANMTEQDHVVKFFQHHGILVGTGEQVAQLVAFTNDVSQADASATMQRVYSAISEIAASVRSEYAESQADLSTKRVPVSFLNDTGAAVIQKFALKSLGDDDSPLKHVQLVAEHGADGVGLTTLEEFQHSHGPLFVVDYDEELTRLRRTAREIVLVALMVAGQSGYNMTSQNCECFANFCTTGQRHSPQIEKVLKYKSINAGVAKHNAKTAQPASKN